MQNTHSSHMDQLPQFTKGATSYTHPSPGGSVQFSVVAQLCPTLCDPTPQLFGLQHTRLPCPSPTSESAQTHVIESVMPSNHLILSHPLLLLPSIFPSNRVFSSELILCIRWPKYWSFSFSTSPSSEYLAADFLWD